jgi:transcriptional regulator with PAS, ATPase and Fis domain
MYVSNLNRKRNLDTIMISVYHSENLNIVSDDTTSEIIGVSNVISTIKYRITQFGRLDTPVLISGESGTGKELVARAIHRNSRRANKPFIAVNCGGLPLTLIESELFGHTQGSFTGATKTKNGLIDAAEGGTLFLDEIGELPLTSQSVFLRILDSGEYYRIGESVPQRADVRIVSATNRNLELMVEEGKFRNDLFYRLKGSCIHLPPLRKRKEDIPELINYFLKNRYRISLAAMLMLQEMDWPGNVRELKMTIISLAGMCQNNEIDVKDVSSLLDLKNEHLSSPPITPFHVEKEALINRFEKSYLSRLINLSGGNITKAAQISGLTRKHLRALLKKANLYNTEE